MVGEAEKVFAPAGPLSRAHAAYEHRPGQQAMASAVAACLERGGELMVEAATGTGKTLAYLVPAILSGRRVIVSTGTRNLQDQIVHQDLPFLRDRLGLEFRACLMKGRDNYLCRLRMTQLEREPLIEDPGEADWIARLASWGRRTETGDRAEVPDLPDRLRLWRDVNARADTCTGSRCPEYDACWLTRMKRNARDCRIVVVNHHLFFADLAVRSAFGEVLPDYDTVIFDEAHLIEEVATLYFGVQLSSARLDDLARQAERLAAGDGGPSSGGGGAASLRRAADDFFAPVRGRLAVRPGRVAFEPPERRGLDLEAEWAVLSEALDGIAREAEASAARGREGGAGDSLRLRAEEVKLAASRVLDRRDPAFVYGMERRGRSTVVLSAAPIDVSGVLRERLFDELHAAVLTSATLTVESRFEFFRGRLGLEDADERVVPSSFDYPSQAALYLPDGMPEPADPAFVDRAMDEISALIDLTEGRAFLLFTSYAHLDAVHAALARRGGFELLAQGQGSKVALVERFRATRRAVLLGTTSFWHGVDVPGEALSLVVVDKLPFDVPSDPVVAARIERIRSAGGNPFRDYQLPLAVLELKQGLGRLLRSRGDRGLLSVLDPRIRSRRYGRAFLDSLPPYRRLDDLEACRRFFAGAPESG